MKQKILHKKNNEIERNRWQELVIHSSTASFFQTPECYNFYASLPFLKPFVFGISENGKLQGIAVGYITAGGGWLKRYFSWRAIISGGLLLDNNISADVLNEFLEHIKSELTSKAIYVEIRNNNDYLKHKQLFNDAGFEAQPHLNYQIALTDEKTVFSRLSESKRRQIKAARKQGVRWEETTRKEDISAYYSILERLYKSKIKRPLFPVMFVEKLLQQPFGKLLVVKKENKVIGGMVCVVFSDDVLYELYVCGDENVDKKNYPSVMATWAGIEYALQNKIKQFDFMGAGKPNQSYGVREFKSRFGGGLVEYGRFLYVCKPFLYHAGKYYIEKILPKIKNY